MTAWTPARIASSLAAVVAAAGLGVDAYVHFDLAGTYDVIKTSTLSQGDLFRAEAVAALVAGLAVLLRPRRYTAALAALVAGSGFAAVMVSRYYQIGKIGPVPSMYEPAWYPEKTWSAWAEAIAAVAAIAMFVVLHVRASRHTDGDRAHRAPHSASADNEADANAPT